MRELLQHAEVHLFQASMTEGAARADLLAQARDLLLRLEKAEKGRGAWRLACISALEGHADLCRRWLERARAHAGIPARSVLETEPYLNPVRDQKWFRRFLRDLDD